MEANVLCNTEGMDEKEWLRARKKGIGASDTPVLLGYYGERVQLWADKVDEELGIDTSSFMDKERMYWGSKLEAVVFDRFCERHPELEVSKQPFILQHSNPRYPFVICNLDGYIEGVGPLEIKTTGFYRAADWDVEVPEYYIPQIMHQMAVTGDSKAYAVCLIGGQVYREYVVERDNTLIAMLLEEEERFWNEHVLAGVPPEFGGSRQSSELINKLYPDEDGAVVDLQLTVQDVGHYWSLHEQIDRLTTEKEKIKNRMKSQLKTASMGRPPPPPQGPTQTHQPEQTWRF